MIPKKIHYCWFGNGDMPETASKCLSSWQKKLPDYELILWNEDNFDININRYVKEAYAAKKFAFVSDVARYYILYNHGGIYLDVDVEVLKSLDPFLENEAFIGFEDERNVNPGLILGSIKEHPVIKDMLDIYLDKKFVLNDGSLNLTTVVKYTTNKLNDFGLVQNNTKQNVNGLTVYPKTFFCPINPELKTRDFTNETHTIHHFSASWLSSDEIKKGKKNLKIKKIISVFIGEHGFEKILNFRNMILRKN